jgi:hypothetical protein
MTDSTTRGLTTRTDNATATPHSTTNWVPEQPEPCGNRGHLAACARELYHGGPCRPADDAEPAPHVADEPAAKPTAADRREEQISALCFLIGYYGSKAKHANNSMCAELVGKVEAVVDGKLSLDSLRTPLPQPRRHIASVDCWCVPTYQPGRWFKHSNDNGTAVVFEPSDGDVIDADGYSREDHR